MALCCTVVLVAGVGEHHDQREGRDQNAVALDRRPIAGPGLDGLRADAVALGLA